MKIFINGTKVGEKLSHLVTHTNLGEYINDVVDIGGLFPARYNYNFEGLLDEKEVSDRETQFLNRIIDSVPNPFFFQSLTGECLLCNRAFEDLLFGGSQIYYDNRQY